MPVSWRGSMLDVVNVSTATTAAALLTALLTFVGVAAAAAPAAEPPPAEPPPARALAVAAPAPAPVTARASAPVTVRVVLYNIRYASYGLDAVVRDLRRSRAQVVLLNEVDDRSRTGRRDQVAYIAKSLGMRAAYDGNVWTKTGLRGNAVLSRFPIRDVRRFDLPRPGPRPRGLMGARLDVRGVPLDVWTSHLSVDNSKISQARAISSIVGAPRCATILGLDTNARPDTPTNRALRTHLRDVWPAVGRGRGATNLSGTERIDYLYVARARPRTAYVEPLRSSDHRAVVGEVTVDPARSC